ncbi:type II toxin-antitoxin system PemK/MazF family toxin [Rufibacter sp. XAAS-G3-1]|uniref:type II toxin-antitoxin system PemK/MazF family toxin n=1 Tax=Rufibacter sp. XAAS-G3-1 TaxID=2729134 RepID=UPI0015E6350E|nr:type II toxin-antitoxin system PemK/MazF family toxin [Rufibacter sp. XAAS-G3-1]
MVKIEAEKNNSLSKPSAADCFQVSSLSELRFVKKLRQIAAEQQEEVKAGLTKVFTIDC